MNSSKLFPKLYSCYFSSLSVSRAIVCSCRPLHIQPSLKVNAVSNSLVLPYRRYSDTRKSNDDDEEESKSKEIVGSGLSNYQVFQDSDSPVILDVDEERRLLEEDPEYLQNVLKEKPDRFFGMNLKRGETGVFDIDELVTVLRNDNARDIITIAVPAEFRYVDYLVIVSGRSFKHLYAMAEYIRKLFKMKRSESDRIPKIEGYVMAEHTKTEPEGWLCLDLGNIALHLFLDPVRKKYDLETLWTVGREFDDLYNMKDSDYVTLLNQHTMASLDDLVPLDDSPTVGKEELA